MGQTDVSNAEDRLKMLDCANGDHIENYMK